MAKKGSKAWPYHEDRDPAPAVLEQCKLLPRYVSFHAPLHLLQELEELMRICLAETEALEGLARSALNEARLDYRGCFLRFALKQLEVDCCRELATSFWPRPSARGINFGRVGPTRLRCSSVIEDYEQNADTKSRYKRF